MDIATHTPITDCPVPFAHTAATPGSLPEFALYHPRRGHPDWPRLAAEARDLAARIGPTLERPRTGLAKWRQRMASNATVLQNYVTNRRRSRAGREDLLPMYFIWTTHRACNFRCTYCDDHLGRAYPELPKEGTLDTAQGLQLLRTMRTRTPSVYLAGGEPMLRDDLPEFTRAARDLHYYPITVNTNASLMERQLKKPAWRTWLADMDIIVVSLDRLNLSSCESLWGYRDPDTVVHHRIYDYTVPHYVTWSTIPVWMLIFWGLILRLLATLARWHRLNPPARPSARLRLGHRCFYNPWLRMAVLLVLVFATRQTIYRFYLDPWLSWLPFAGAAALYGLLFGFDRHDKLLALAILVGGPLIEVLYIQVGGLHRYHLGWLGGVPLWIALWWVVAMLVWKDFSGRILSVLVPARQR